MEAASLGRLCDKCAFEEMVSFRERRVFLEKQHSDRERDSEKARFYSKKRVFFPLWPCTLRKDKNS